MIESREDFEKGDLISASLSEEGVLRPAPLVEKVAELPVDEVWWVLPSPEGDLLLGASPGGRIFRVTKDGQSTVYATIPERYPYAAALGPSGELYVGGSPGGKVYRIVKGKREELFDPKETYIWSLLWSPQGDLFVGTGIRGRVYRVNRRGSGSLYSQMEATHVRCLSWDPWAKRLLAGGSDRGVLVQFQGPGPEGSIVIADSGRQEIPRIVSLPSGDIFFLATGLPTPPASSVGGSETRGEARGDAGIPVVLAPDFSEATNPGAPSPPGPPRAGGISVEAARPVSASAIWRLDRSLYPLLLQEFKGTASTLDWLEKEKRLLVGIGGQEALLYRCTLRGEGELWAKLGTGMVSAAYADPGGTVWVVTSHPCRMYRVSTLRRGVGIYESSPLDSGLFARWGSVRVTGKGKVHIETRTGNVPRPGTSWYGWQPVRGDLCQNPPARYLQFRLRLEEDGFVNRVEVAYLPQNVPPQVTEVDVLPSGFGYTEMVSPPGPPAPKTIEQLLSEKGRVEGTESLFRLPTRYQPREGRGLRTVVWKAVDPDGDVLRYRIDYRREPGGAWQLLAKDLKEPIFTWDTSGWPDGQYRVRVEASDQADNAPGEGRSDSLESSPFVVDNTPPAVRVLFRAGDRVRFEVTDLSSGIKSVLVSTDGREFLPALPKDGMVDSQREEFEVPCPAGSSVFIRAEDQAGNVSSAVAQ
ncbi:WD40 repeat domain-containing protein [Candidatus Methylacidithermus pantelleriae]|uniref:hypothetical protein n=1 Tax=Candidatus Methylacidithermus pantelleriae TaxID=2744239 RepID=UPI00157DCAA2|nr:hypothetical protein [Candidatus Methylacidithermus pantelleriae]